MMHRSRQRGFTVLELIIVTALLALAMAVLARSIRIGQPTARDKAVEVTALLKAARTMSIATGKMHRLMLDMEHGQMRIEMCADKTQIRFTETEEFKELAEERRERQEAGGDNAGGEQGDIVRVLPDQLQNSAEFQQVLTTMDPTQLKDVVAAVDQDHVGFDNCTAPTLPNGDADGRGNTRSFPDGIQVSEVHVQHLSDPIREGAVSVSFFPMGRSEKAIIQIEEVDDRDEVYSVLVHGLTGRVELRRGKLADPDEHMRRDGAGDRTEDR